MKKYSVIAVLLALIMVFSMLGVCVFADDTLVTSVKPVETKNGITTIDELDGKLVGVQTAVLYEELLLERLPNTVWQYYTMPNDMILALQRKKISAYLIEEVGFYAQYANHPELVCLPEYAGVCPFSIVVGDNENQAVYLQQINSFIAKSKENGFLDELYDYWVMHFDADTCVIRNVPETTGENGVISIAIEGGYEPFSFESNGEFSGFDVEFMMNFCAEYGYTWDFKSVPFESIAPGAETGKYDFGMNIAFSDERSEGAQLSQPYYDCNIVLVLEGVDGSGNGFFRKIADNFYKTFIKENRWKLFASGTGITVFITICSIVFGTLLGFAVYMLCRHGNKLANGITGIFTALIDGMPTVVFLMILFYIILGNTRLSGTWISIVGFTLIFACGMYDMLCVGCNAVNLGQTEASRALGYSDKGSFFKIVLPQAAAHFLPIYRNEIVSLIKETSVVGYIAVLDLTKISDLVRSRTYEAFFALIATAVVYFLIEGILVFAVKRVQISIDPKRRPKDKILSGIDTSEWE